MTKYNKADIGRAAAQYGFVRDTFEKVLRLKEILKYFNTQEYLATHLILKGGTAINLTVFNLPRLSVDIDMDYTPNDSRDNMLVARKQITGMIREYMEREGYSLSRASRFSHSLDAFYYNYLNAGGNKDIIKIELNYSLRAHIYEASHRSILNDAFKSDIKIRTVAPIEIFAAKGNALISRAATRDLYDWGNMMEQKLFEGERDLFRKCFAFYTTISADKDRINRGFDTSAIDTLDFMKIRRDLFPVINKKNDFRLEERKRQAKQYISNLMQLTEKENEYMDRFMAKEYRPELLFDDEKIIERIYRHPMAIWKCSKQP
ncbi:MAG: nucleotidyl transferase AbiEii/AbiGii toxin family protein [Eubacterium sp.]|nr:nucleotidyl transferase AbiEii/AbiGii toxin family protein [Eubacterium sp.]